MSFNENLALLVRDLSAKIVSAIRRIDPHPACEEGQ
jgi:hypothetical protein